MPTKDDFFLSGLEHGWFSNGFDNYVLFGYVGDKAKMDNELQKRSIWWKALEKVAPKLKLASLLKLFTGFDLGKAASNPTLIKDLFDLVKAEQTQRTVTQILATLYKRERKQGLYFDGIVKNFYKRKHTLFGALPNLLEGKLITVEGQLIHRDSVAQHSSAFAATLRSSSAEWILADFPPHALSTKNRHFDGNALLLAEDKGFSKAFGMHLPFAKSIGWYPYARITGFFTSARLSTEKLPALSLGFVEYRPPLKYIATYPDVRRLAESEVLGTRNHLDDWSDFVLFSYLTPLILLGANMTPSELDPDLAGLLNTYREQIDKDLPVALNEFYTALTGLKRDA